MLSNVLTVVLFVTFVSCNKEYKKSENSNVETVEALNQGSYQSVIDQFSSKKNLSPRERYYLASAYSQSGGVDAYSLYSVMEIQLFHKKALEWSDLSKEKNPYLKFMKNQEGIDYEKRNSKRAARWEKYLPQIKLKNGIQDKPTFEKIKETYSNLTAQEYEAADAYYNKMADKITAENLSIDDFDDAWYKAVFDDPNIEMLRNVAGSELQMYYGQMVYLGIMKTRFLNPDQNQPLTGNIQWEMLYMNILWNTYEAIPIMKKLPKLSNPQQEQLTLALEEYLLLIKTPKFKEVSLKSILILSGVSLLSIYSQSFDLEEVDSIQDLYCSFDPNMVLDNYGLIRKRILFLEEAYKSSGMNEEAYIKYKDQIEAYRKVLPEELTVEQRSHFIESIDKFKVDSCFNG